MIGKFKKSLHWLRIHFELCAWSICLLLLALSDPASDHFTLCVFNLAGIDFCPGCGIGHSIAWLFRFEFERSVECHILGMPALLILLFRILHLLTSAIKTRYEPKITVAHSRH
jgi:hypothetical protein